MGVKPTSVSTKEVKEVVNAMAGQKPETSKNARLLLAKNVGLTKTELATKAGPTSSKSDLGNVKVDAAQKQVKDSKQKYRERLSTKRVLGWISKIPEPAEHRTMRNH